MVFSKENGSYDSTILLTVVLDFVTHTVLVVVVLVSNTRKYPRLVNFCCTLETIDQNFQEVPQNDRVGLKVTVVFILTATIIMTETILQYKYSSLQQMNLQQDGYTPPHETIKNLMNTYWLLCDATYQVIMFCIFQLLHHHMRRSRI
ncbi:hypothetical protein J6590_070564 [Homalodisca vitripennis]|nr:hypothetical protein J6590_070564 [Homalodisca vitripennis]